MNRSPHSISSQAPIYKRKYTPSAIHTLKKMDPTACSIPNLSPCINVDGDVLLWEVFNWCIANTYAHGPFLPPVETPVEDYCLVEVYLARRTLGKKYYYVQGHGHGIVDEGGVYEGFGSQQRQDSPGELPPLCTLIILSLCCSVMLPPDRVVFGVVMGHHSHRLQQTLGKYR